MFIKLLLLLPPPAKSKMNMFFYGEARANQVLMSDSRGVTLVKGFEDLEFWESIVDGGNRRFLCKSCTWH